MKTFKQHLQESKVIMYHGSDGKFDSFSKRKIHRGSAIFLTPQKMVARSYGKYIYEVEVETNNVFMFNNKNHLDRLEKKVDEILEKENKRPYDKRQGFYPYTRTQIMTGVKRGKWHIIEFPLIIRALKELKFDGFYALEGLDQNYGYFDPKNLKIIQQYENL